MTETLASERAPIHPDRRGAEYLANERTFLAWIRTSIALLGLGFVLARVVPAAGSLDPVTSARAPFHAWASLAIADGMIAVGALLALLASWRYHVVNKQIERGVAQADRWLVLMVTILVIALAVAMILLGRR